MRKEKIYHHKDTAVGAIADQESVTNSIHWLDGADFWIAPSKKNPDKLVIFDLRNGAWKRGFAGRVIRMYFRVGGVGMSYFHTLDCGAKIVEGGPDFLGENECNDYADAIKRCEDAYLEKNEKTK